MSVARIGCAQAHTTGLGGARGGSMASAAGCRLLSLPAAAPPTSRLWLAARVAQSVAREALRGDPRE